MFNIIYFEYGGNISSFTNYSENYTLTFPEINRELDKILTLHVQEKSLIRAIELKFIIELPFSKPIPDEIMEEINSDEDIRMNFFIDEKNNKCILTVMLDEEILDSAELFCNLSIIKHPKFWFDLLKITEVILFDIDILTSLQITSLFSEMYQQCYHGIFTKKNLETLEKIDSIEFPGFNFN